MTQLTSTKHFICSALLIITTASFFAWQSTFVLAQDAASNTLNPSTIDKAQISVVIDKSDYTLSVYYKGKLQKTYPVVFGGDPVNDKHREGDQRTPEGTFKVRSLYPHKDWTYFVWINYPTKDSWAKHQKAKQDGLIPQHATIGGEIGIHGVPDGYDSLIDSKTNWTLGCISLKNKDIRELYPLLKTGSVIKVQP